MTTPLATPCYDSTYSNSTQSAEPVKREKRRYRCRKRSPATIERAKKVRREKANNRERRRMNNLNTALEELRKILPQQTEEPKMTKIETLRVAQNYITFLSGILTDERDDITLTDFDPGLFARAAAAGDDDGDENYPDEEDPDDEDEDMPEQKVRSASSSNHSDFEEQSQSSLSPLYRQLPRLGFDSLHSSPIYPPHQIPYPGRLPPLASRLTTQTIPSVNCYPMLEQNINTSHLSYQQVPMSCANWPVNYR